jgi:UDP-N-acetyl-D-galactosamine dehydrogenase
MNSTKIAIIGLGYVGLPLALEFSKKFKVIGYDINKERVNDLLKGKDSTNEVQIDSLFNQLRIFDENVNGLKLTTSISEIENCNIYIVTVPTPINVNKQPDLNPLINVSKEIGKILKKGDIVIYESTVYPGCTEEVCCPILERESKLILNEDFFLGYSPERINPGDKINNVTTIKKVVSGSNQFVTDKINTLYLSIIKAGTYVASSIKVAEASKALENAQRDINIAFINDIAKFFDKLNLDTNEVLEAAATKWNFMKYKPGLVGGHCISVDPYYLIHKAKEVEYDLDLILAGRNVNESMGSFVANKLIKIMISKGIMTFNSRILILGITFKENCPDIRNSRILEVFEEFKKNDCHVDVLDPIADPVEVQKEFGINILSNIDIDYQIYSGILICVGHDEFTRLSLKKSPKTAIYDVKGILDIIDVDGRL